MYCWTSDGEVGYDNFAVGGDEGGFVLGLGDLCVGVDGGADGGVDGVGGGGGVECVEDLVKKLVDDGIGVRSVQSSTQELESIFLALTGGKQ